MELFPLIFLLSVIAGFVALVISSYVWLYRDAEARGKSGCLVSLIVFLIGWPLSLLVWLIFRPENKRLDRGGE